MDKNYASHQNSNSHSIILSEDKIKDLKKLRVNNSGKKTQRKVIINFIFELKFIIIFIKFK